MRKIDDDDLESWEGIKYVGWILAIVGGLIACVILLVSPLFR